jgi:hypothetical protein
MSDRSLAQQANALITKYVKLYTERYDVAPVINRYRDKWGFTDMLNDLGKADSGKVLEYYFGLRGPHTLVDLFRRYDELHKWRLADEEDKRRVAQLHKDTAKRVKEYLERNGDGGTGSSSSSV